MNQLPIIPYPESCEIAEGLLDCSEGFAVSLGKGLEAMSDIALTLFPYGRTVLSISVDEKLDCCYSIECRADGVCILVREASSCCPALLCLYQAYEGLDGKLPLFSIKDNPRYEYRGFMLDCCRHFFAVPFIKKILFFMSLYRMNFFHWHLSDDQAIRFAVPGLELEKASSRLETAFSNPEPFYYQGIYSESDLREVVDCAAMLGITVIPEIETPGHASALLSVYPELGCRKLGYKVQDGYGIFSEVLCPGKEKVFEVLDRIIGYLASIFPGPYIHLGGDECPTDEWQKCPDCQAVMKKESLESLEELQGYFSMRVTQIARRYGKRACGWNEVLYRQGPYDLDPSTLVYCWQGREALQHKKPNELVLCPNTEGLYLDYKNGPSADEPGNLGVSMLSEIYNFDGGDEQCIKGIQANLWTEVVLFPRWAEYMIWPRLAAVAESAWTKKKDLGLFMERLGLHRKLLDSYQINYCRTIC